MNKLIFFLISFAFSLNVFAEENINLKFLIQQTGNQLLLDSIYISNLTRTADTVLYYPDYELKLDLPSNIDQNIINDGFYVFPNYPNPFDNQTFIEVFMPANEVLEIRVFDNSGRLLQIYKEPHYAGKHRFTFYPGSAQKYILNFSNGLFDKSIKLIHSGSSGGDCRIEYQGIEQKFEIREIMYSGFSFHPGDSFRIAGYVTVCQNMEYVEILDVITESKDFYFDFTYLSDIQPEAPEIVSISETETTITWEWSVVDNAEFYKVNNVNDFETATDNGNNSFLTQTNLIEGTNYVLYVWAANHCGESFPLEMHHATAALPLTPAEIDFITADGSNVAMDLLSIFQQPDSIILRTPSTNIIIGDEHLDHLAERMHKTVIGVGVGIAAPQIGINRRVIWVQRFDFHPFMGYWHVYYNPRITQYSQEFVKRNDGCLSVPQGGENPEVEAYSYRAKWIEVEYWDKDGLYNKEIITHEYTAHIFQHEIDHLDGIMFFDLQELEKRMDNYKIVEGECYEDVLKRVRENK